MSESQLRRAIAEIDHQLREVVKGPGNGRVALTTDDASLMERIGHHVDMVQGSRLNLKITTPEDLELAERLVLSKRLF